MRLCRCSISGVREGVVPEWLEDSFLRGGGSYRSVVEGARRQQMTGNRCEFRVQTHLYLNDTTTTNKSTTRHVLAMSEHVFCIGGHEFLDSYRTILL
jgi:hypothetical protein